MLDRIMKSFTTGVGRVKWVATFLAERTKAETSIAKIHFERSKIENKMDGLYRDIGKRVLELKKKGDDDVFKDLAIQHALSELKHMNKIIDDYKAQADNINKQPHYD